MDVRNCKTCGRMFNYIGGPSICPSCSKLLEDQFDDVKKYIYDHPGVGIQEVSQEMNVSVAQIQKWLKEERLSFSDSSEIALNCELCGARILTGRFCKNCKGSMANQLNSVLPKKEAPKKPEPQKTENKMRFLEK